MRFPGVIAFILLASRAFGELAWESTTLKLTAQAADRRVSASFHFKNAGAIRVTLLGLYPTCDCTTATATRTSYEPGEAGEITAVYEFGEQTGLQRKVIRVQTETGTTDLWLEVMIHEAIDYTPRLLLWHIGEIPREKIVTVSAPGAKRIRAIHMRRVIPLNSASVRIEPTAAGDYQIAVRPLATAAGGKITVEGEAVLDDRPPAPFSLSLRIQ